ncbi:MAG: cell division protein ZapA [Sphingobacteriia bacterium]|nr:cell division protein ZapA [Sphingobacteriia bacterium]
MQAPEKLSVKVYIANRAYPLWVNPTEEEAVRNAAKEINDRMRELRDQYGMQDDLDLIIMQCLEIKSQLNLLQLELNSYTEKQHQLWEDINQQIDTTLQLASPNS